MNTTTAPVFGNSRWAIVDFDQLIVSGDGGTTYTQLPSNGDYTIVLDSVYVFYNYESNGGSNLVNFSVYNYDDVSRTQDVPSEVVNPVSGAIPVYNATRTEADLTASQQLETLAFYPNVTFSGGDFFSIYLTNQSDTTDQFSFVAGYKENCNNNELGLESAVPNNSTTYTYLGAQNGFITPNVYTFSGGGGGTFTCNRYFIQNILVVPFVTISSSIFVAEAFSNQTLGQTCPGTTFQLTSSAVGGSGNYSYSWSPSTGLSNPNIQNPSVTVGNTTQSYTLTVTDLGNNNTVTSTINVVAYPVTVNAGPDVTLNCGQTTNINATASATGPGVTIDNIVWSGNNSNPLQVSTPGQYTVTATNSVGCSASDVVEVSSSTNQNVDFNIPSGQLCTNSTINFQNTSSAISGWDFEWVVNFDTIASTVNFFYSFPFSGLYEIRLIARNGGCVLTTVEPVTIQNCGGSTYCSGTTNLTSCSGSFNDGSGFDDYFDNSNCSWLIQPSGATSITLNFSSFNTESCCDYVEVYDGATTSAPSIGYFSGSSIPPSVTSSGGSMLVRFTTDASVTESGWSASYFCNTGTSNCPGPATGQPFYRPNNNIVDCIVNGQFYSEQVEFEVPTSINPGSTLTVYYIRIDSLTNLPCGINYTLDRPGGLYYGGEVACITLNGISNDPAGQYNINTHIEIDMDAIGTYQSTLEGFIDAIGGNGSDEKLILRVKNTQGSNCPPVNTGSSGLTASANCNIPLGASPSASPDTICIGGQSQLSANAYGGSGSSYTYSWSNHTTLSCSTCDKPIATPVNTTDYSVTVSDGVNSVVRTKRVTVTTSSPPCPPQQCTYVLDPDSTNISAAARTGLFFQVDVASGSNCSWTASLINNPGNMISLASASGNGSGIVTFDVADNLNSNPRVATILVGNQTHTVVQAANTSGCGLAQPTINRNNEPQLLASNHGNVEYAWYRNNDPTPVASGQFYTVTSNGCYKVRITEFGNPSCFNESNPACVNIDAIENIDGLNSLSIFPNPSNGEFNIEIESKTANDFQIRVFNTIGKEIYKSRAIEIQGKHSERLDLNEVSAGLYLVEIIFNNKSITRKLFIQR